MRWIVSGIALAIVSKIGIGVHVDDVGSLVAATIVIGLVNSLIRPIIVLLTLPLNCLTFGLFGLLVNAGLFAATHLLVPGFHVDGFLAAALGSILMSILSGLLGNILPDGKKD
jgi:putative membrane protein